MELILQFNLGGCTPKKNTRNVGYVLVVNEGWLTKKNTFCDHMTYKTYIYFMLLRGGLDTQNCSIS